MVIKVTPYLIRIKGDILIAIVFLSHQLGSSTSVWLGGRLFNATGSYDVVWWAIIVADFAAALIHWPINDRPAAQQP